MFNNEHGPPDPEAQYEEAKRRFGKRIEREYEEEQDSQKRKKRLKLTKNAVEASAIVGACVGTYVLVVGAFTWVRNVFFGAPPPPPSN